MLAVIQDAVGTHGTLDERTALIGFQQNPAMFRPVLEQALLTLATREPGLLRQFQTIAEQATVGGTTITASGDRSVAGLNISGSTIITGDNHPQR